MRVWALHSKAVLRIIYVNTKYIRLYIIKNAYLSILINTGHTLTDWLTTYCASIWVLFFKQNHLNCLFPFFHLQHSSLISKCKYKLSIPWGKCLTLWSSLLSHPPTSTWLCRIFAMTRDNTWEGPSIVPAMIRSLMNGSCDGTGLIRVTDFL